MINKVRKLSLFSLISNLLSSAPKEIPKLSDDELSSGNIPLTVRFEPTVHNFYSSQAEHIGTSVQSVVAMVLKSVMLESLSDKSPQLNSVCQRFRFLFEMHSISEFDIPKYLPEIKKSDLLDDQILIDAINEEVVANLVSMFKVNEGWLKGDASMRICSPNLYYWYKSVLNVIIKITKLKVEYSNVTVNILIPKPNDYCSQRSIIDAFSNACQPDDHEALPITIAIEHSKIINGKNIPSVILFEAENWNHSRCRDQLGLIYHILESNGINPHGYAIDRQIFNKLQSGNVHPVMLTSMLTGNEKYHWDIYSVFGTDGVFDEFRYENIKKEYAKIIDPKIKKNKDLEEQCIGDSYLRGIGLHIKVLKQHSLLTGKNKELYLNGKYDEVSL